MDIISLYKKFIECNQIISTDSRTLELGSLFFGWKGEILDGNNFASDALEKGAKYAVIDNPDFFIDHRTIVVPNVIKAFQDLARHHRRQFNIPVIAIGGSNGKTTTKELVADILSTQKKVVSSHASLNNHIGVPMTLFRITNHTDIAVIEMGANHIGEIAELCIIAAPTHGLITNIGRDHIGHFGSQDAIIKANAELYDYLRLSKGEALVNKNNLTLMKFSEGVRQTCYAEGVIGEFGIESHDTAPYVSVIWKGSLIETQLTGEYNVENILAAIAVGVYFDIRENNIISALESYVPQNNRSEILETIQGNIVIKDFYNANRTSMKASLNNLAHIQKKYPEKKNIAILGDMLDLGEYTRMEHQAVLDYAISLDIKIIILIGKEFSQIKNIRDNVTQYLSVEQALLTMKEKLAGNSIILLKASNGTNFKKLFSETAW
jgi:UDP-N-acetylmuramoyl-tripeptide--D-alanyl-D-alanine ligase